MNGRRRDRRLLLIGSAVITAVLAVAVLAMGLTRAREPAPESSPRPLDLDCASEPSRCGYPDDTNTGVSPDAQLLRVPEEAAAGEGWHFDDRGWVAVDQDGATLENLEIPYTVDITASDVVVRNVRVSAGGETFGIALRHTRGVTIEDSEIGPPEGEVRLTVGIKDVFGDAAGTVVRRNEITRTSTGVQIYSGLIERNFIHSMAMEPGDHVNGVTSNGSTVELRIVGNTILNSFEQTDAIGLFQDFGVEANRIIAGNLLAGGGYSIYGGANPDGAATSGIRIAGNRIARLFYPDGGAHGPVAAFDPEGEDNVWAENIWDDTGAVIPVPVLDSH